MLYNLTLNKLFVKKVVRRQVIQTQFEGFDDQFHCRMIWSTSLVQSPHGYRNLRNIHRVLSRNRKRKKELQNSSFYSPFNQFTKT